MKKLGKKLSNLMKIFLASGILFTNLSSLSIVFADELTNDEIVASADSENLQATDDGTDNGEIINDSSLETTDSGDATETLEFSVTLNDSEQIVIRYSDANKLDGVSSLLVDEQFTYVDGTSLTDSYEIAIDDIKDLLESEEGYIVNSKILSNNIYDGEYLVNVTIDQEVRNATLSISSENGFEYAVYDSLGTLIECDGNVYTVPSNEEKILIKGKLLMGGVSPSDVYTYDGIEYSIDELVKGITVSEVKLLGYLYGEFTINVSGTLNDALYSEDLTVLYGSYNDNTALLNESANTLGVGSTYMFEGDNIEGILKALSVSEDTINEIVVNAGYDFEKVTYAVNADALTLSDEHGVEITYSVTTLDEDYLSDLIEQVLGNQKIDEVKSDVNGDDEVNTLDVIYLAEVIRTGSLLADITDNDVDIARRIDVSSEDIISGDEFTVDYVLTLSEYAVNGIGGTITYDSSILELVSITSPYFIGNNNDGKFLYVGSDSLIGKINEIVNEDGSVDTTYDSIDYVVLTATFRALQAGSSIISVSDVDNFNQDTHYTNGDNVSTEVVVNASSDNSLSSLTVAGQSIQLQDDVLEYSITVGNDVTLADVIATLANDTASISSIVSPEELTVGENEITIVVTAENGDEKVYTIIVTREEAQEEETTVSTVSYQNYNNNDGSDEKVIVDKTVDDDDKKTEDDTKDDIKDGNKLSRIIIIILILLAIAGLIFLIFKDDDDDETKKANREINKLKKEDNLNEKDSNKKNNSKKTNKKGR